MGQSAEGDTRSFPAQIKRRRRRSRTFSVQEEIRRSAKQIHDSQMAEAMKAAALLICARKLDEVKALLAGLGISGVGAVNHTAITATTSAVTPTPPAVRNPCVNCGRAGIYKSKPSQWNKTGSWFCRTHMVLGISDEADSQNDRRISPQQASMEVAQPQLPLQTTAPGATTLAEAFGAAELVDESS